MKKTKRNIKDGIFRALFHSEDLLLELYNALSGSNYPKGTPIEIITLENAIFGDLKNDLAFIIDNKLIILIEHQSTINPNMPVRMLLYIAKEYEKLLLSRGMYSKRRVPIPTPEFYVFYNGIEEQPLEQVLKLSDAFIEKCDTMELTVKVINVNYEKGAEILERCKALSEYSRFIHMIRSAYEKTGNMTAAIEESIHRCQKEGVLADFLKRNGGDLVSVLYEALTTEECLAIREEDGYCRGFEEGEVSGFERGEASGFERGEAKSKIDIAANMLRKGMKKSDIAEITGLSMEEVDAL